MNPDKLRAAWALIASQGVMASSEPIPAPSVPRGSGKGAKWCEGCSPENCSGCPAPQDANAH